MDNSYPILFPICLCLSSTAGPGFVIYDSLNHQNKANQESLTDQVWKYHNFLIFSANIYMKMLLFPTWLLKA